MEKRRKTTTGNCFEDHVSKESKRKKMKPITEKLRRERINNSLEELKHLILSAMDEDVSHYAKMEKADILEMTVKYIKSLQKSSHQGKSHAQDESTQESNSNRTDTSHMDDLHGQAKTTSLNLVLPAISEPADSQSVTMETSPVNNRVTMDTANVANKPVLSSSSSELLANDKNMNVIAGMGFSPIGKKRNYLQCDRNDSRKALLSVREQNAMNSGYRKEYLSPNKVVTNHTQKVRLPGMECFIKNNFKRDVVFRETDKENATDFDFDHQYFAGWQMSPDDSQYSLAVWRPWGK